MKREVELEKSEYTSMHFQVGTNKRENVPVMWEDEFALAFVRQYARFGRSVPDCVKVASH